MLVWVELHGKPRVQRHTESKKGDDDMEASSIHQEYLHQETMYHVPAPCYGKNIRNGPPFKAKTQAEAGPVC